MIRHRQREAQERAGDQERLGQRHAILPGKNVRLTLLSGNALRPGTYTATITLTQAKKKTTVTKKVTVRR